MKYCDNYSGIGFRVAGYIGLAAAALVLTAYTGLSQGLNLLDEGGGTGGAGADDDPGSPINRKIDLDLMYGTDDFFGEDTDLSYADRVTPSGKTAEMPTAGPITVAADTGKDKGKDRKKEDSGDSGTGDSGDTGDSGGGDDPPSPPPPPPPDPDCPD